MISVKVDMPALNELTGLLTKRVQRTFYVVNHSAIIIVKMLLGGGTIKLINTQYIKVKIPSMSNRSGGFIMEFRTINILWHQHGYVFGN